MPPQLDVAIVALVISLVALVIALGQVIQQYFATAEGYRRCREDVLGAWSELKKSPFDWRNLRYETRFVSPEISFAQPSNFYIPAHGKQRESESQQLLPIGHAGLPSGTIVGGSLPSARVSWLALLEHVRNYQLGLYLHAFEPVRSTDGSASETEKGQGRLLTFDEWFDHLQGHADDNMSMPVARKRTISWDFMPPDAMKPFATISLHDLLILGHRLGLDWVEVDPNNDRLIAQDDFGNDLSAHRIRGLGLMVQFQHDSGRSRSGALSKAFNLPPSKEFIAETLMVPSLQADKLAFGVIPGDSSLGLDDVLVANQEDCFEFVNILEQYAHGRQRTASEALGRSFTKGDLRMTGLDQLMPLLSPCLVLPSCKTTSVRRPNDWCHIGILEVLEGYVVYEHRTKAMAENDRTSEKRKETIQWIKNTWHHVQDSIQTPFVWAAFREHANKSQLSTVIAQAHRECTEKLGEWSSSFLETLDRHLSHHRQGYRPPLGRRPVHTMLCFHILRAVWLRERTENIERSTIETYGLGFPDAPMFCGMMHMIFDDLDALCTEVIRHTVGREVYVELETQSADFLQSLVDDVSTAWLIWIFRALLFNRSATFVEPRRPYSGGRPYSLIPAKWLYSQIPIHIS